MEKFNVDFDDVIKRLKTLNIKGEKLIKKQNFLVENDNEINYDQEIWINQYEKLIDNIPNSNGCRYYEKIKANIGIICDVFFYNSISSSADFVYVSPNNYEDVVNGGIDGLLFVSTWAGLSEDWRGIANISNNENTPQKNIAFDVIKLCKNKKIPTIFYSKEDPPNYEVFIDFAKECDYVYTSANECIDYYREDCNREQVDSVCFGINPQYHNPIGFYNNCKEETVLFSGSWMEKYPNRCTDMSNIFDGILKSKYSLHIIDRNYPLRTKYMFPNKYLKYVSPSVVHDKLQKLHKLFDWSVNINTVTDSSTMFANRNFELQACGNLLISNYSVGVNSLLPNVFMVNDSNEVVSILDSFTKEEIYEHQLMGIRNVMTNHTCYDRIAKLLEHLNVDTNQPVRKILVLTENINENIQKYFDLQTYEHKYLLEENDLTKEIYDKYDMITWFNSNDKYDIFYLEDLANGFKYTNCDYITKDSYFDEDSLIEGIEHNYVSTMKSKYRTLFWSSSFDINTLLNYDGVEIISNGYSIDHMNYIGNYKEKVIDEKHYKLSVIVPVYNNGMHLYGKCFSSLRRSTMFNDMKIILVDDGSTDNFTPKMINFLKNNYDNIETYFFSTGGSGSASRPRNKGVDLVTTEYLTFLDPDNEAICDGYANIYQEINVNEFDLVFGNMKIYKNDIKIANYYNSIFNVGLCDTYHNSLKEFISKTEFLSISIQTMIIKTEILKENQIKQIEGAIGQDTLFSWQLLCLCPKIRLVKSPIHIYYANTENSVTNQITDKYFQKLFLLQEHKISWLKKENFLNEYMRTKYCVYTKSIILRNLIRVSDDNAENCVKIINDILNLYSNYYENDDELINKFIDLLSEKDYMVAYEYIKNTFNLNKQRNSPSLFELYCMGNIGLGESKFRVEYKLTDNNLIFINCGDYTNNYVFAWEIRNEKEKIFTSKYSTDRNFNFDFINNNHKLYIVKAYIKSSNDSKKKISDVVAVLEIDENDNINIINEYTTAIAKS